jgi:hypothetical protein
MQGKRLVVEAVSVEAVIAGDAPGEIAHDTAPGTAICTHHVRETVRMYSGGQWHERPWWCAKTCARRRGHRPGHHCREERHHRGGARLGSRN